MARLRTIKPGFFLNDELAQVEPIGRLLFAGLWCIADRRGRLEDRPIRIKAEVLPYDNCDVDRLLSDLAKHGFVQRYTADGVRYIQIANFEKHQTPHIKEAESVIPAPCLSGENTVLAPPVIGEWELGSGNLELEGGERTDAAPAAARKRAPRREYPPLDDEFMDAMRQKFEPIFGPDVLAPKVRKCIEHMERKKVRDQRSYLEDWLNNDAQRFKPQQPSRGSPLGGTAGHHVSDLARAQEAAQREMLSLQWEPSHATA